VTMAVCNHVERVLILVPLSATCPSFTSPARSHSLGTCTNSADNAARWRRRNSEMVRKSGASSATIAVKSTRSAYALAIRREE